MSKWVRGIYNTAANFNMSGSLRAASGRTMDRNPKHVREERDQSDQRVEPSEPIKSSSSATSATACTRTACSSATGTATTPSGCSTATTNGLIRKHKYVDITANRECNATADYIEREYVNATKGERDSTRVWACNESRYFKQTNNGTTNDVEHITGIPTGVTV